MKKLLHLVLQSTFVILLGLGMSALTTHAANAQGVCCSSNGSPGCENAACQNAICAIDAWCCTNTWDGICGDQAIDNANLGGACAGVSNCPAGGSSGPCCTGHTGTGCEDAGCQSAVCANDSWCCTNSWDGLCAADAVDDATNGTLGGACAGVSDCPAPPPPTAPCCTAHGGSGCENAACEAFICGADPFCCNNTWDATCAADATFDANNGGPCAGVSNCPAPACSAPTVTIDVVDDCTNNTFEIFVDIDVDGNSNDYDVYAITSPTPPFCDQAQGGTAGFPSDPGCESSVCAADPFCCNTSWDGLCGDDAALDPNCTGCLSTSGTSTFIGTFTGGTFGISAGTFPVGELVDILVEHNDDASCDQTFANIQSNAVCGCIDPAAANYDPAATTDDGSCVYCTAPTLTTSIVNDCSTNSYDAILDIGNDGDATDYDVYVLTAGAGPFCDQAQTTAGFPSDPGCESSICAADPFCCNTEWDSLCAADAAVNPNCTGCLTSPMLSYVGTFVGGTTGIFVGTAAIGDDIEIVVEHNDEAFCNQTLVLNSSAICGCTDGAAFNFDPSATEDDGSCVYPPANNDCANAQSLSTPTWPATSNALGTLQYAMASGGGACVGFDGADVFYTFNAATPNHYFINLNPFGGMTPAIEVYDACGGTLIACEAVVPGCDQAQGSAGYPADPGCQASVCGADPFCCNTSWDSVCASAAASNPNCSGCLTQSTINALVLDLDAGSYIIRVRDLNGLTYTNTTGNFLINVQSFPTAKVQDNAANAYYACNTVDRQLEDVVGATPQTGNQPGVMDYEWYVERQGGGFTNTWVRGAPNYATKLTWLGMEYNTTYNVYVRMLINIPGHGPTWGVHQVIGPDPAAPGASECTISTSNTITLTELRPQNTPTNTAGNAYAWCDIATAKNVADAENFEWEFTSTVDASVVTYVRGTGNPNIRINWVDCLVPGTTYDVRVRAQVDGDWGAYGASLPLDLAPTTNVGLRPNYCGGTYSINQFVLSTSGCGGDEYEFELTNTVTSAVHTIISSGAAGVLNTATPPLDPGATYSVRVKVTQCGAAGDFSTACNITIAGPQAQGDETPAVRTLAENSATLYPNPNAGSEVRVELDGLGDGNHEVMIQIYDVYGKLIQTEGFGHNGSAMSRLVRFNGNLAMGMYMVQIVVDGERFSTERLVVK